MSIIDRLFVGSVVKNFGHLELQSFGIGKRGKSVLLAEKRGELFFAVKSFAWAVFGGSVRYYTFRLVNALKLREFINNSEQIACGLILSDNVKVSGKLFVGQVVRDFGCVEQEKFPLGRINKCALLAKRGGELHLVLKFSQWALLGWNVGYQYFVLEDAYKLRGYITESEKIAANLPPLTYDPRAEAGRNSLLTAVISSVILLLMRDMFSIAVGTLITLWVYAYQWQGFWRYQETRMFIVRRYVLLILLVVAIVVVKAAMLT